MHKTISLFAIIILLSIIWVSCIHAEEIVDQEISSPPSTRFETRLDERTIARGVTLGSLDGVFVVGITSGALEKPATLSIESFDVDATTLPDDYIALSQIYELKFEPQKEVVIKKALPIIVKYAPSDDFKELFVWNEPRQQWIHLPSDVRLKTNDITSVVRSVSIRVVVLSDTKIKGEGIASWYPLSLTPKDPLGVAHNEYPIGTQLRVINLNDNDSVVVTVVSRGPYYQNRIIDLTRKAFGKIAHPTKEGVIRVALRPVEWEKWNKIEKNSIIKGLSAYAGNPPHPSLLPVGAKGVLGKPKIKKEDIDPEDLKLWCKGIK